MQYSTCKKNINTTAKLLFRRGWYRARVFVPLSTPAPPLASIPSAGHAVFYNILNIAAFKNISSQYLYNVYHICSSEKFLKPESEKNDPRKVF